MNEWGKFFELPLEFVIKEYENNIKPYLCIDGDLDTSHIVKLHDMGYLPLAIYALPEGSKVNIGVPSLVIYNTEPEFFWLVNYIETSLSSYLWQMCTNATTAYEFRKLLDFYAEKTSSNPSFVDFQCHDFSFRGMGSHVSAINSGMAHLLSFLGTDTLLSIKYANKFYPYGEFQAYSVPATEHSVMSAHGKDNELQTFKRLITETYPKGIVSIVSDTWDFWNVITNIAVELKDIILNRDGKVVFRPDSGNPADILCGKDDSKGAVEILWDIFGGTINDKGYKELDPHVGIIYGDSITLELCEEICKRLDAKCFASTNVVFGVGSYTYQYVTRDTDGYAIKATYCEVNGEPRNIFKDPITDNGIKKSAKGILSVHEVDGEFILEQESTFEKLHNSAMRLVFKNGKVYNMENFNKVRNRLLNR